MIHIQLTGSCDSLGSCLPLRVLCSLSSISNDYPIPLCKGSPKACRPYIVSLSCVGRQVSMQLHNLISLSRFMRSMPHAAHEEQEHNLAAHHPLAPSVRSLLIMFFTPLAPIVRSLLIMFFTPLLQVSGLSSSCPLPPTAAVRAAADSLPPNSAAHNPHPISFQKRSLSLVWATGGPVAPVHNAHRQPKGQVCVPYGQADRLPPPPLPCRAASGQRMRIQAPQRARARQGQLEPAGPSPRPPLKCAAPPPTRFGPTSAATTANPEHIKQPCRCPPPRARGRARLAMCSRSGAPRALSAPKGEKDNTPNQAMNE